MIGNIKKVGDQSRHLINSGILLTLFMLTGIVPLWAQNNLLDSLDKQMNVNAVNYAEYTFKGTRLINGQTVETRNSGSLIFLITHRFGEFNTGLYNFYGLDVANIRFGFDYSITDRLTLGIGRNSLNKIYDGFLKYKLTRQCSGARNFPFTTTLFGSADATTQHSSLPGVSTPFNQRLDYTAQILLARKFSGKLSIQLMPSVVHHNYVATGDQPNTIYALGAGGRFKITNRMALTAEYYYRMNGARVSGYYNSLSFGIDIETGGHVFQIMFTNSNPMIEEGFISQTTGSWSKAGIHLGFNISRIFNLKPYNPDSDWK